MRPSDAARRTAMDRELSDLESASRTRALTRAESERMEEIIRSIDQRAYREHARRHRERKAA